MTAAAGSFGIVHLTAEYWPYIQTGGLAEAVRGIASSQAREGMPTAVVLPLYRRIRDYHPEIEPWGEPLRIEVGPRTEVARLHRIPGEDGEPEILFVENPEYFDRMGVYGDPGGVDYEDNPRRFALLCRAALEACRALPWRVDLVHLHDWHTALAAVYLRTALAGDEELDPIAVLLSVHNAGYQGHFGPGLLADLGLPERLYDWEAMEWYGHVNVLKGGLVFSDFVATVSPGHAHELRTRAGGFGLHDAFSALKERFVGIRNGIDQELWNPATDPHIEARYSADDRSGKAACKRWLQKNSELELRADVPLFAMSARLVQQKGLDLILGGDVLDIEEAQFAFLGTGEPRYEQALTARAHAAPGRIVHRFDFTHRREHQLLAGADALLMPSQYEPCGLTQMRAQRYGVLPVVRRVGGLADTVEDQVTGFVFDEYEPWALSEAVRRALAMYEDRGAWEELVDRAMARDFGWEGSSQEYLDVYARALAHREASR